MRLDCDSIEYFKIYQKNPEYHIKHSSIYKINEQVEKKEIYNG